MRSTRKQQLINLIDEMIVNIKDESKIPFDYVLCPHFEDCFGEVNKLCISNYRNCPHYNIKNLN